MALTIAREIVARLLAEAAAAHPGECCGVLLGTSDSLDRAVPAANVAASREHRFEIDPVVLIAAHKAARAGGPAVVGYYHSHPRGPAKPSAEDRRQAAGDGRIWAIVAGGTVRLWRDSPGGFEALSYRVTHG